MEIKGKIAIVTGGSRCIGRAISLMLAKKGVQIAIFDLDEDKGKKVSSEIRELGRNSCFCKVDISSTEEISCAVDKLKNDFGTPQILVNNATVDFAVRKGGIEDITESIWDKIMAVNVKGAFFMAKKIFPYMKAEGGKIINITSVTAQTGSVFGQIGYVTSKAALIGMTRALALEGAKYNITVNAVAPGLVRTELLGDRVGKEKLAEMVKNVPLERPAEMEEVAEAVVFLCSNDYMTGQTLYVCGGSYFS
ncbi:MAG: hypothetical protein A2096_07835 [Spirochaetes bacterium GWF1_41_5]|nr:MAG: hypothetical protein A2096_07835 [Spirochaetes bacterium GWF1_41_5]